MTKGLTSEALRNCPEEINKKNCRIYSGYQTSEMGSESVLQEFGEGYGQWAKTIIIIADIYILFEAFSYDL